MRISVRDNMKPEQKLTLNRANKTKLGTKQHYVTTKQKMEWMLIFFLWSISRVSAPTVRDMMVSSGPHCINEL